MCGIAAVYNGSTEEVLRMGKALNHRGNVADVFEIDNLKVYFSWLPITDKNAPMQPFRSGSFYVWMNGYISNYKELAHSYGIDMTSNCDTEFLAKFIDKMNTNSGVDFNGIYTRMSELNGFFSILFYDERLKRLGAVTDRYGIKQMYHYFDSVNDKSFFASEVKAILSVCPEIIIDDQAADDWLYSLGVMNDHTIYQGIKRIECLPFYPVKPISISYTEAKNHLMFLLQNSIQRNKVDGLHTGVFLSGGIDSGILADRLNPDYCFSMDYLDDQYSEIENIKRNSKGLHHTLICNRRLFDEYKHQTVDVLDDLKVGSCYTNFALTELASKFCTVLYSGAGGDEVFDGYAHRYARPINEVIKRTEFYDHVTAEMKPVYNLTHKEYDWKYLRGILVVEDRIAGFHTMETRYPLLDNDFVNFALSLPAEYRKEKRILKDISGLTKEVVNGKKRGFSNPFVSNFDWASFAMQQKIKGYNQ